MPEEIEHLSAALSGAESVGQAGYLFRSGRLDGYGVVLVESGVGKVNAAVAATLLLGPLKCRGLIVSGVAGGIDPALGIGDIVIAERLVQHDYGAMLPKGLKPFRPGALPLGEPKDPLAYVLPAKLHAAIAAALQGLPLPPLSAAATGGSARQPVLRFGTIVTGDQFVNSEPARAMLFQRFGAQAVEMEGAAVAQVAERFGAPCVIVRALSDLAGAESHMDIVSFLRATAATASMIVRRLVPVV